MKILVVRHLESIANLKRVYSGWSDVDITNKGIKRGLELRKIYSKLDLNGYLFFSSSLLRARKSMEIMFPNKPYTPLDGLKETNFGIFEMKTYPELKDTVEFQEWISGNFTENVPPQGESYVMMGSRIIETLQKLLELKKDLVIVTHGGPLGIIMRYLLNDNEGDIYKYDMPNGEGFLVDLDTLEYKKSTEVEG